MWAGGRQQLRTETNHTQRLKKSLSRHSIHSPLFWRLSVALLDHTIPCSCCYNGQHEGRTVVSKGKNIPLPRRPCRRLPKPAGMWGHCHTQLDQKQSWRKKRERDLMQGGQNTLAVEMNSSVTRSKRTPRSSLSEFWVFFEVILKITQKLTLNRKNTEQAP